MAGAGSPSPQRHPDTAYEFQFSSDTTNLQCRGRPRSKGHLGGHSVSRRRVASRGRSSSLSKSTERARGSSTSQPRSSSRLGNVSSEPTKSRSRTPTTPSSKNPTLSWADKAQRWRLAPASSRAAG
ncbi:hypothetical protein MRX96_050886 [Rhipicephalus microplus]